QRLITATALILMLNSSLLAKVNSSVLDAGRWVALALFCVVLGLQSLSRHSFRRLRLVDAFLFVFVLYALGSAAYSADPELTLQRGLSFFLLYVATFWGVWDHADRRGAESVVNALLWATA